MISLLVNVVPWLLVLNVFYSGLNAKDMPCDSNHLLPQIYLQPIDLPDIMMLQYFSQRGRGLARHWLLSKRINDQHNQIRGGTGPCARERGSETRGVQGTSCVVEARQDVRST